MVILSKIKNKLKVVDVETYIYVSTEDTFKKNFEIDFPIIEKNIKGQKSYWVYDNKTVVHKSFLYTNVQILKLIKKSGLVIGSCYTNPEYRGRAIYPKVINYIAKENISSKELFLVVNVDNISSIKGIEKAGFKRLSYIKAKKWLFIYFRREIILCD